MVERNLLQVYILSTEDLLVCKDLASGGDKSVGYDFSSVEEVIHVTKYA